MKRIPNINWDTIARILNLFNCTTFLPFIYCTTRFTRYQIFSNALLIPKQKLIFWNVFKSLVSRICSFIYCIRMNIMVFDEEMKGSCIEQYLYIIVHYWYFGKNVIIYYNYVVIYYLNIIIVLRENFEIDQSSCAK
jgi:hypothetical protein